MARSDGVYKPAATSIGEFVRDVTSTPAEFDASLRQAAAGCLEGGLPSYRIADGEVRLQIDVAPGAERRIALVRLPTLIVTYRFTAGEFNERFADTFGYPAF